jgi:hypothetical protein
MLHGAGGDGVWILSCVVAWLGEEMACPDTYAHSAASLVTISHSVMYCVQAWINDMNIFLLFPGCVTNVLRIFSEIDTIIPTYT